jgi:DNA polymerase-1
MKLAMIKADETLAKFKNATSLLQIHDSILVEAPAETADEVARALKETMEHVYKLPVKLTVDTGIGKNWGEL